MSLTLKLTQLLRCIFKYDKGAEYFSVQTRSRACQDRLASDSKTVGVCLSVIFNKQDYSLLASLPDATLHCL